MGLLDRARHVGEVQLRANVRDVRGTKSWQNVGDRITVRCAVQPVREWSTSEEQFEAGIQMLSLRRVFARTWPGNIDSHFFHNGLAFETVGDPQFHEMSRRTKHWVTTVRLIGVDTDAAHIDGLALLPFETLLAAATAMGIDVTGAPTKPELLDAIRDLFDLPD